MQDFIVKRDSVKTGEDYVYMTRVSWFKVCDMVREQQNEQQRMQGRYEAYAINLHTEIKKLQELNIYKTKMLVFLSLPIFVLLFLSVWF